ncbi:MAG: hypothetical protein QOG99_562 [Frankiales bacterium]|nr:hypothetical protein [Frankiales bacterium]
MNLTVVAVSLAAAVAFGWSSAAMHRGASATPADTPGVVGLLRHITRDPLWVTGMAASLAGLALHAVALRNGAIGVVQPLVVQSLAFSLLFRAALEGRTLPRAVLGWAGISTIGLALFLGASRSTAGRDAPDGAAALVVIVLAAVVAGGCWWLAGRSEHRAQGALLGATVGIWFGLTAGALKATVGQSSAAAALESPALYVLLALGLSGQLLNQVVYRRAELDASLPTVNTVNPVVALIVGSAVFAEQPTGSVLRLTLGLAGLGITLVALTVLAWLSTPSPADG